MRRRDFIAGLGCAAVWPVIAGAQRPPPVIGSLDPDSPGQNPRWPAFREGLSEAGFIEGRNVAIEYRYARLAFDRLLELAWT
jgi:putative tryptophan/tyrosine transport system substrate-binding protein